MQKMEAYCRVCFRNDVFKDLLMMDDMVIVQNFFDSFDNERIEMKWGLMNSSEGSRMTLLAVCAKDK